MAIGAIIKSGDTIKISKSFGIVGSAVVGSSKIPVVVVAANNNEPIQERDIAINKPLVKMINALASIDGFIKQRLENQKIIVKNDQLAAREAQIEQPNQEPQIEEVKPDAEKVSGSGIGGLLGLGALGLLAFDPVQDAIKQIADGVVSVGGFVIDVVKSINSAFSFLFGGSTSSVPEANPEQPAQAQVPPQNTQPQPSAVAVPSTDQQEKPSFMSSVASGAMTGAAVGSFIPRVGAIGGAIVGGIYGAGSSIFGGGTSTTPATPAQPSTTPPQENAQPVNPAAPAADAAPVVAGEIPKNDIVALGNYLASKGADKSQMENMALSGRVGDHSQNSRHYRGMAIDVNFPGQNEASILDSLEPQLRAAGYNTIWRKPGHETHMHVSVGGPEGTGGGDYGDSTSLMGAAGQAIGQAATASMEQLGKVFGAIAGAVVKPGVIRDDIPNTIATSARQLNTDIAVAKTEKPVTPPPPPLPPNINKTGGTTENPASSADKNSVYYYLRRFGYQDLNVPTTSLPKAVVA